MAQTYKPNYADSLLQVDEIQGLVISGYAHLRFGAYLFLKFGGAESGKKWLAEIAHRINDGGAWPQDSGGNVIKPKKLLNFGVSYNGLLALGITERSMDNVDTAFKDGMTSSRRSQILGDNGISHPDHWTIGGTKEADDLHAVLIILADSAEARDQLIAKETEKFEQSAGNEVLHAETAHVLPEEKEHFGFRDGISQPSIADGVRKSKVSEVTVMKGEFVLGYRDEYNRRPSDSAFDSAEIKRLREKERAEEAKKPLVVPPPFSINGDDIGKNGTYLVFRKMRQNVPAFWNFAAEHIPEGNEALPPELRGMTDYQKLIWIASKWVGRWPSGAPLALTPTKDDPGFTTNDKINSFLYNNNDKYGYLTPVGSHTRRGNPRNLNSSGDPMPDATPEQRNKFTANRHQIIRRGMPYGSLYNLSFNKESLFDMLKEMMSTEPFTPLQDDGVNRGLMFFCINANIARQFEFIQQTWVNNTKFHKLYNDKDPVIGDNPDIEADEETRHKKGYQMNIQMSPLRRRTKDMPRFVTVEGGAYFFMPSITAIYKLAGADPSPFARKREQLKDRED